MERISFEEKLASFEEPWVPKVVAELNGQYVKVAKCRGEYVWHQHTDEDEAFLVVSGRLDIHFIPRAEDELLIDVEHDALLIKEVTAHE